jgi:hypothetical protein
MEVELENQLNIKLSSNIELRLIIDDSSSYSPLASPVKLKQGLRSHLDLIVEDRERLKKTQVEMIKERSGFLSDLVCRKKVHEELLAYFSVKNSVLIKKLEIECKALNELCMKKKGLIGKMRGILNNEPVKENTNRSFKPCSYEVMSFRKSIRRESLSPCTKIESERRKKIAAFRHSVCN